MNKKTIALMFCIVHFLFVQSQEKTLSFISDAHLDTQWNWTVKSTIDQYILNTMVQNFVLFEKYPGFRFNFEGAIKYMWMKEYYPTQYATLKKYIKSGQWNISGGAIDADDVMVPSAESIIRNFLYAQTYYKREFGIKGGSDIMLPDCFGFPYSLPSLGKHCGAIGFHTAKLAWGSPNYDILPPFGIWKGVDGSEIYTIFKPGSYSEHGIYNKDMSYDEGTLNEINSNYLNYGIYAAFHYVGVGDQGGALQDDPTSSTENTPYWLQTSMNSNGPVTVSMETPTQIFHRMDSLRNPKYVVWNNELPMTTHGTGCYTSQTIMKYWNRKNELLADNTEKSSVISDWLGGLKYPMDVLRESWIRMLWNQFHDDITGTSIPSAYVYSYNDEVLANLDLSKTLLNSVGAVAKQMNTQVDGIPLVVYNPLSINRTDIVESSIITDSKPNGIRVLDGVGNDVLAQILNYNSDTGELSFIFQATVPSLGYAVYELRLNESKDFKSSLSISEDLLENESYKVEVNGRGDVASIYDKKNAKELLLSPLRLAMLNDRSETWPSWEILWNTVNTAPISYVDENVNISIEENGPLRVSLKVSRTKNGSEFVQHVRMTNPDISDRIDFVNEVNWQSRGILLKAIFPLSATNSKATYDISLGAIERGINTSSLYEVQGHQWADQLSSDSTYGVSILNDCKYGWDKPNNIMLRLSLIRTPAVSNNYVYQKDQDLGLNKFTYSFYRHDGKWNEATQWEAARLNQPLLAFQAAKHSGVLGKSYGFASLNTDKVSIKALKKAEDSDEIIIRVYELTGNDQNDVKITFPANIISANEVNGIEEKTSEASFSENSLSFNIGKFQPKTFAVKLESPVPTVVENNPSSIKVGLDYNIDVISYDSKKNDATSGVAYAYPAELLSDVVTADGIDFAIGNRDDGNCNAISCNGQTVTLPANSTSKKLYILAASRNVNGSDAEFTVDKTVYSFTIPYYVGNVGCWGTEYNLGTEYRRENVAFTATHRHNVSVSQNDSYNFMYMYKYCIPVNGNVSTLTLPKNNDILVFAISLSDNENDNITPASVITSLPENSTSSNDGCSMKLTPATVSASNQNGSVEGADKAIDGDVSTKWCVVDNSSPWLELTFTAPVEICRWFILNAGVESADYITSDFRLQKYTNGQWIDVDVVTNNTDNKVDRSVEPFTANRIRLHIDKGEQNGYTTRILEFAVFGTNGETAIQTPQITDNKLSVIGNNPNPFNQKTSILCRIPENVAKINLNVYDLLGRLIDKQSYPVTTQNGIQEITWSRKNIINGIYLYFVSALEDGKFISSSTNKMIIYSNLTDLQ